MATQHDGGGTAASEQKVALPQKKCTRNFHYFVTIERRVGQRLEPEVIRGIGGLRLLRCATPRRLLTRQAVPVKLFDSRLGIGLAPRPAAQFKCHWDPANREFQSKYRAIREIIGAKRLKKGVGNHRRTTWESRSI